MDFSDELRACTQSFIRLSPEQIAALEQHWLLLERWNRRINLTAIRSPRDAIRRHYAESLFLGARLPPAWASDPLLLVDVGSGAGFPGFPIAVSHPNWQVTLCESHTRKGVFLSEAARLVSNVRVHIGRAEELPAHYHLLTSRAVSWSSLEPLQLAPRAALLSSAGFASQFASKRWRLLSVEPIPWDSSKCACYLDRRIDGPNELPVAA